MSEPRHRLDASRQERIGLDEAIYCAGKSAAQPTQFSPSSAGARRRHS